MLHIGYVLLLDRFDEEDSEYDSLEIYDDEAMTQTATYPHAVTVVQFDEHGWAMRQETTFENGEVSTITYDSEHDGIHTFHVGKNAVVTYSEVHYGEGEGEGKRILNPQTILYLEEGARVTLESTQIRGVDDTKRYTKAVLKGENAEFIVQEKLLTHGDQKADSVMDVFLDGENSSCRVISRSVAQDESTQTFYPRVVGNTACFGHVQCDSIIMGKAKVRSIPEISCNHVDAGLIHEAAIGKIAGDQILKLQTLGLSYEEAEEKILEGFLR